MFGGALPSARRTFALACIGAGGSIAWTVTQDTYAQEPVTLNGPPQQVIPYASEPGAPTVTVMPGALNPFPNGDGNGSGTFGGGNTGGSAALSTTGGAGGGANVGSSDVLNTMMATTWGSTASANAEAVGVNPSALAATCALESGCGANLGSGTGGAQGVFQMYPAAFQAGLQTALAANPQLASQIVPGDAGRNDPTTEAIAASGYLMMASQSLQNGGISNLTVLDARGYYNFGPSNGVALANAQDGQTMSSVLYNMSPQSLAANGITPGETVGQWRASISSKIGNSAGQGVLL